MKGTAYINPSFWVGVFFGIPWVMRRARIMKTGKTTKRNECYVLHATVRCVRLKKRKAKLRRPNSCAALPVLNNVSGAWAKQWVDLDFHNMKCEHRNVCEMCFVVVGCVLWMKICYVTFTMARNLRFLCTRWFLQSAILKRNTKDKTY